MQIRWFAKHSVKTEDLLEKLYASKKKKKNKVEPRNEARLRTRRYGYMQCVI